MVFRLVSRNRLQLRKSIRKHPVKMLVKKGTITNMTRLYTIIDNSSTELQSVLALRALCLRRDLVRLTEFIEIISTALAIGNACKPARSQNSE